jgi:hypothetical protein
MAAVYQAPIPGETLQIPHCALVYQGIAQPLMNMPCNAAFPGQAQQNDKVSDFA